MLMKVNDTIRLCRRYITVWFVSIPLEIAAILFIIYSNVLSQTETTSADVLMILLFVNVIILIAMISLMILWFVTVILLIISLTKVNEVLGSKYSTYLTLCIVGFFVPLLSLIALITCFLIKRDLNHYIQAVSEMPTAVTESINPAVDAVN